MHWIVQFLLSHKNFSSFLLTVILSLVLLSVNTTVEQRVARALTVSVFFPFQFTIAQFSHIKNIFAENRKLKEEVTRLSTRLALVGEAAAENEKLRQLIGFKSQFQYDLLPANAVVREPSFLFRSIVINVGSEDGAAQYMPVVSKDGAVGKIIQVFPKISLVQLLRDPSERISVMIARNKVVGILETINSQDFFIQYQKYSDIKVGDTVVTSGLGGIYPRGINVGVVKKIKDKEDPLFKNVHIDLFVAFEYIDDVFVIRLSPQWSTFRQQLDSIDMPK